MFKIVLILAFFIYGSSALAAPSCADLFQELEIKVQTYGPLIGKTVNGEALRLTNHLKEQFEKNFKEFGYNSYEDYLKYAEQFGPETKNMLKIINDDLIVGIHAPETVRLSIMKKGILNQRLTGTSLGQIAYKQRDALESRMMGFDDKWYVNLDPNVKAKYGTAMLNPESLKRNNIKEQGLSIEQYGTDIWIVKKEVVNQRASWTPGDSLAAIFRNPCYTPSVLNRFLPWNMRGLVLPYVYYGLLERPLKLPYPEFYGDRNFRPAGIVKDFKLNTRTWDVGRRYVEVQVWGELNLNDFEAFQFKGEPPSPETLEHLRSKNIKVYDARGDFPEIYRGQ